MNSRRNFILMLAAVFISLFAGFAGSDSSQANAAVIPSSTILRHGVAGQEPVKLPKKYYKQFKQASGFNFVNSNYKKANSKPKLSILLAVIGLIIAGLLSIFSVIGGNRHCDTQKNKA